MGPSIGRPPEASGGPGHPAHPASTRPCPAVPKTQQDAKSKTQSSSPTITTASTAQSNVNRANLPLTLPSEAQLFALCCLTKYTLQETAVHLENCFGTIGAFELIKDYPLNIRRDGPQQRWFDDAKKYPWYSALASAMAEREFVDERKAFIVFQAPRSLTRRDTCNAYKECFEAYLHLDGLLDELRQCRRDPTRLSILKEIAKIYPWYEESPYRPANPVDLQSTQSIAKVTDEHKAHWALQRQYGALKHETLYEELEHTTSFARTDSNERAMKAFHLKLGIDNDLADEWVQKARVYPWWRVDTRDPEKVVGLQSRVRGRVLARQRSAAKKAEFERFYAVAKENLPKEVIDHTDMTKKASSMSTMRQSQKTHQRQSPLNDSSTSLPTPDHNTQRAVSSTRTTHEDCLTSVKGVPAPDMTTGSRNTHGRNSTSNTDRASAPWETDSISEQPVPRPNVGSPPERLRPPPPPLSSPVRSVTHPKNESRLYSSDAAPLPQTPHATSVLQPPAALYASPDMTSAPSALRPASGPHRSWYKIAFPEHTSSQLEPAKGHPPIPGQRLPFGPTYSKEDYNRCMNLGREMVPGTLLLHSGVIVARGDRSQSTWIRLLKSNLVGDIKVLNGRVVAYMDLEGGFHDLNFEERRQAPPSVSNVIPQTPSVDQYAQIRRPCTPEQQFIQSISTSLTPDFQITAIGPERRVLWPRQNLQPPARQLQGQGTVRQQQLSQAKNGLLAEGTRVNPITIKSPVDSVGSQRSASPRSSSFRLVKREQDRW